MTRLEELRPRDVPRSRHSAIVLARMQMFQMRRGRPDGRADVFFLDVRVEGIEEEADGRVADGLAERGAVGDGVEEEGFEPVQGLDANLDARAGGRIGHRLP